MMELSIFYFFLLTFCIFSISYMIAREDGPFDLFSKMRGSISAARTDRDAKRIAAGEQPHGPSWIERGINCVLCVSFWVALIFTLLIYVNMVYHPLIWFVVIWQAFRGAVVLIQNWSIKG